MKKEVLKNKQNSSKSTRGQKRGKSINIAVPIIISILGLSIISFAMWSFGFFGNFSEEEISFELEYDEMRKIYDKCKPIEIELRSVNCNIEGFCNITIEEISGGEIEGLEIIFSNSDTQKIAYFSEETALSGEIKMFNVFGIPNPKKIKIIPYVSEVTSMDLCSLSEKVYDI